MKTPEETSRLTWIREPLDDLWRRVEADSHGDVEERAAILEYDGKFTRSQSERMAIAAHCGVAWPDIWRGMGIDERGQALPRKR